jgi:hypothetical protein
MRLYRAESIVETRAVIQIAGVVRVIKLFYIEGVRLCGAVLAFYGIDRCYCELCHVDAIRNDVVGDVDFRPLCVVAMLEPKAVA